MEKGHVQDLGKYIIKDSYKRLGQNGQNVDALMVEILVKIVNILVKMVKILNHLNHFNLLNHFKKLPNP